MDLCVMMAGIMKMPLLLAHNLDFHAMVNTCSHRLAYLNAFFYKHVTVLKNI